jgi:hypothetical protein
MTERQSLRHHYRQAFGKQGDLCRRASANLAIGIYRSWSSGAKRHVPGALPVQEVWLCEAEL